MSRLTSAFLTKPNVRAMLAVYLAPLQELENAAIACLQLRNLSTAQLYALPQTNIVFDAVGAIVGLARNGLPDTSYKALLLLEIAVNRATGGIRDWSGFAAILAPFSSPPVSYIDGGAGIYFGVWNLTLPPVEIAGQLTKGMPNGVGGVFAYSTWADGNDFSLTSVYGSYGEAGPGSVYDAGVSGGLLVAGASL